MRKIILVCTALLLFASVAFGAVNYKEKVLTPNSNTSTNKLDSTRAQAVAAANWVSLLSMKSPTSAAVSPGMIRVLALVTLGDTDCDSTTVLWLTSPDKVNYITRDSLEMSGNTAGNRVLFTANVEDSVFEYNMIIARPQCDDAAAAVMTFNTYFMLYDGLGQLYDIRKWIGIKLDQIAGGGI